MSNLIYATIKGKNQGLISAGCSTFDSIGNKYQENHRDQILVYSATHSLTRIQHVSHHPFNIIKPIDKSSPLLGLAISNNEELHILLDFYRTSSEGAQEKFYSIELTKAKINALNTNYPHSLTHAENQPEESISVIYQNITWSHHIAGTSAYSIRDDEVY
ncbi:Hcp family type VI secretion system effector [Photorhabdus africana]|uniref:Hcp family type VI secretion system effector n=1 Tax=Photorhabdus africana TaxID=3097554 RepID=UPI002B40834D|nr:Hcp family type VI secretion system effector [Photorhabdus sp. CRI-LC]